MPSYTSTESCRVASGDHLVDTRLWFTTPPLDSDTISKVDKIQLFTKSKDQGWVSDPHTSSYSWFELVILNAPEDKTPKLDDSSHLELAWRSHVNIVASREYRDLEGPVFDNTHDICRLLRPGNAIGIRVCTRFAGWVNDACEGRLEIHTSNQPIERSPPKPEGDQVKASEANSKLLEMFQQLYEGDKIELSWATLARLEEPVPWDPKLKSKKFPVRRETVPPTQPKITLLALDGGGIRGISSLYILDGIMRKLAPYNGGIPPKPCEVFDLIGGTSTGGLIAIMLGRLGMTVQECIEKYESLAREVFVRGTFEFHAEGSRYDAGKLKTAIRNVIGSKTDPDASMVAQAPGFGGCRCVVFACNAADMEGDVTYFRNYPAQDDAEIQGCKIWEAARATTAAPTYFESITIGQKKYTDGGLRVNNPVGQTITEAGDVFDQPLPIGCVISLGTGRPPKLAYNNAFSLPKVALDLMTSAEVTHDFVKRWTQSFRVTELYRRFNAPLGKKVEGDTVEWVDEAIDLSDVNRMAQIVEGSIHYVATQEVQQTIDKCVEKLRAKLP